MSFVRIDGTLLHYRLSGPEGAPALIFVNSLGTDARIWDAVIAAFSDRYLCVSYDKRGHGLSDAPRGEYGCLTSRGFTRHGICLRKMTSLTRLRRRMLASGT